MIFTCKEKYIEDQINGYLEQCTSRKLKITYIDTILRYLSKNDLIKVYMNTNKIKIYFEGYDEKIEYDVELWSDVNKLDIFINLLLYRKAFLKSKF
jgi:hypothetical protein